MKNIVLKLLLMFVLCLFVRDLIPKLIINAINGKESKKIFETFHENVVYAFAYSAAMISYYYISKKYLK